MKRIAAERKTRIMNGAGFLSGVIAIVDAFGEATILWPPSVLWKDLRNVRRVALGSDVAVLVISFLRLVVNKRVITSERTVVAGKWNVRRLAFPVAVRRPETPARIFARSFRAALARARDQSTAESIPHGGVA
jgi:hypothetical protein